MTVLNSPFPLASPSGPVSRAHARAAAIYVAQMVSPRGGVARARGACARDAQEARWSVRPDMQKPRRAMVWHGRVHGGALRVRVAEKRGYRVFSAYDQWWEDRLSYSAWPQWRPSCAHRARQGTLLRTRALLGGLDCHPVWLGTNSILSPPTNGLATLWALRGVGPSCRRAPSRGRRAACASCRRGPSRGRRAASASNAAACRSGGTSSTTRTTPASATCATPSGGTSAAAAARPGPPATASRASATRGRAQRARG